MTLTINREEDEQRQLLLTVEVDEGRVEKAMRRTAKKLARDFNVPGFRRGKAPYRVIVNRVGRDVLRGETVEELVPEVFEEVLADVDQDDLYGRPELTDMEMEPLVIKFTLPLQPVVELGDYRAVRQEVEPVEVKEEAVEQALERIREKYQELEEVDRPLEPGDMVTLSGTGKLVADEEEEEAGVDEAEGAGEAAESETADESAVMDEEEADEGDFAEDYEEDDEMDRIIFAEERIDLPMDPEQVFANTPFVDNLVGLAAGDETTFSFTFPEDYENEDLAGQEAIFELQILNVQSRDLPELDDDLARREGDYETLAALREATRKNLEEAAEARAKEELIEEMTGHLLEDAGLVYPPAAVEMEIDNMTEEFKSQATRAGWEWEDFLRMQGISEEMLRENFRESAVNRLEQGLVIRQFVLDEKLRVEEEDVDTALDAKVARFEDEDLRKNMREYYQSGYGFDTISSEILHDKVYGRVKDIFIGNAPDLSSLEEEDEEITDGEEE